MSWGYPTALAALFMTDIAREYLKNSNGWAVCSGPGVVAMDKGAARSMTSTTLARDVYAFPFGQRGFMAGLGRRLEDHPYPVGSLNRRTTDWVPFIGVDDNRPCRFGLSQWYIRWQVWGQV